MTRVFERDFKVTLVETRKIEKEKEIERGRERRERERSLLNFAVS